MSSAFYLYILCNKFYTNFMLASTVVHVQWLVSNSTQQHCIIETHDKAVIYRTCFFSVMGLRHAENQQINFFEQGAYSLKLLHV